MENIFPVIIRIPNSQHLRSFVAMRKITAMRVKEYSSDITARHLPCLSFLLDTHIYKPTVSYDLNDGLPIFGKSIFMFEQGPGSNHSKLLKFYRLSPPIPLARDFQMLGSYFSHETSPSRCFVMTHYIVYSTILVYILLLQLIISYHWTTSITTAYIKLHRCYLSCILPNNKHWRKRNLI